MKTVKPYLLIAPALVLLCVFCIYPIFNMIGLSLYEWDMISPFKKFVGLQNFVKLAADKQFLKTRLNGLLQSVAFSPYIVSLASIALLWMWLMNNDFGFLNALLAVFGIPAIDWLGSPKFALMSLIIINVWKSVGYNALILVSALQGIPPHLYEAARLDRANTWRTFSRITFPMISPTVFFLALVDVIAAFKVFETIQIITQGGPQNSTNTLVFSLYEYGFQFYKVGYAAAIGVVLFFIVLLFTILYFAVLSKRVHYQ